MVVDLCAGSGAIALAISVARPDARVVAVERSLSALSWARRNIVQHIDSGGTRVELRGGDVFDQRLLFDLDGTADLVTANPPYVPVGTPVEPEVLEFDPAEAVFGGVDGLAVIKPLISIAAGLLKVGGAPGHRTRRHPGRDRPGPAAGEAGTRRCRRAQRSGRPTAVRHSKTGADGRSSHCRQARRLRNHA